MPYRGKLWWGEMWVKSMKDNIILPKYLLADFPINKVIKIFPSMYNATLK